MHSHKSDNFSAILLEIWLRVKLLLTTSFFFKSGTGAGWADCSKTEKAGRDLFLRAKKIELFESVFFSVWLTLWPNRMSKAYSAL